MPPCSRSSRPGSCASRSSAAASAGAERPSNSSPFAAVLDEVGDPAHAAATTGSRPARHSATTSGAQSHQSEGITAASRPARIAGQLRVRERAGELDDSARVERLEPLGERPWDLAVDADAQVAVDQLRRLDEQLRRPCAG